MFIKKACRGATGGAQLFTEQSNRQANTRDPAKRPASYPPNGFVGVSHQRGCRMDLSEGESLSAALIVTSVKPISLSLLRAYQSL
ncbi:hypothetical protein [Treponema endosymbiont of Eucomonympha sp.]|uniref:hypothetical protein n=1 Tax=Treponema endosymbiont of Eucomonympha sp. TaxID=1580831 RepID=UPI001396C416|nr:hypothetical protein [Treponema endosymbiont of Eucomonympha sp.]